MNTPNPVESAKGQAEGPWLNVSLTLAVLAAICALAVGWGRHHAAAYWSGGNFPPAVGHMAIALVGSVTLAGMGASLLGAGIAAWRAMKAFNWEHRRQLGIEAAAFLVNLAAFFYMKP